MIVKIHSLARRPSRTPLTILAPKKQQIRIVTIPDFQIIPRITSKLSFLPPEPNRLSSPRAHTLIQQLSISLQTRRVDANTTASQRKRIGTSLRRECVSDVVDADAGVQTVFFYHSGNVQSASRSLRGAHHEHVAGR